MIESRKEGGKLEERSTPSILKRYLFSYIFIFSIPFIVFLFIINRIYIQDVKEETSIRNEEYLEQANVLLNEQLVEVKSLANYIETQNVFNRFSPYTKDEFNTYREVIKQHELTTSSIDALYVIYNNGDRIFTSQGTTSLGAMYGSNPRFTKIRNKDRLEEFIFSGEQGFSVQEQKIYYTSPLGSAQSNPGLLLIEMNTELIKDNLEMLNRQNQGVAFLMDPTDEILLAQKSDAEITQDLVAEASEEILTQDDFRLNNKKYFSEKKMNELTGWSFLIVTDARSYNQPFYQVVFLSIIGVMVMLAFGLFFSYYFAKKNYQPLKKILRNMEIDNDTQTNEWRLIENNLKKTYSEVENLNLLVDQQTPIVRNATLLDLIKGQHQNENETELIKNYQELNIDFPYPYFAVAIIEFKEAQIDMAEIIQKQRSKKTNEVLADKKGYHVDFAMPYLNNYQIFLIINLENKTEETRGYATDKIRLNFKTVVNLNDNDFTMAVGSTYSEIKHVKKSYIEASTALEAMSKSFMQKDIVYYDEIDEQLSKGRQSATLEYPTKSVLLLLQSLKKMNYAVAKEILSDIFDQIKTEHSDEMIRRVLIIYIFNNIVELSQELELNDYSAYLYELNQATSLESAWNLLDKLIHNICIELEAEQKVVTEELGEKISSYVYQEFSSPDISLEKIAEEYGVSISYVSQLVKEETGETFSVIIQNLRMDKFKDLLVSTSKPINQLVIEIGYFDASNFSRKFRKENNMTPSQYRKKYQEKNN